MSKLSTHEVREVAKQIVAGNPGGIRFAESVRRNSEITDKVEGSQLETEGVVWIQ